MIVSCAVSHAIQVQGFQICHGRWTVRMDGDPPATFDACRYALGRAHECCKCRALGVERIDSERETSRLTKGVSYIQCTYDEV